MRQCLVFEISDDQLDVRVLAMLGIDGQDVLGAVGDQREVPPIGEQLGLVFLGSSVMPGARRSVNTTSLPPPAAITRIGL